MLHYSNIGQCRTGRRTPLSKLFKLHHYEDYLLGVDSNRVAKEDWLPYIKDPSYVFLFPTDKDVEDLLLRVAIFTLEKPTLASVLDPSQTVPVENSAGENPVQ